MALMKRSGLIIGAGPFGYPTKRKDIRICLLTC
jgi:hypothetical protein